MALTTFDVRYAGTLYLSPDGACKLTVAFEPSALAYQHATGQSPAPGTDLPRRDVIRFDADAREIEITPIIIYPPKDRFLRPRFNNIRTILFEGYEVVLPQTPDEVKNALAVLPEGFYKRAEYGLGLPKVYLPFIKQIEHLTNVTRLVVSKVRDPALNGDTLTLGHDQVDAALTYLSRIADRHQRRSLQERNAHVWNHLISPLDPDTYPEEVPPYTEDTIFETLNVVRSSKLKLSSKDETALVSEVQKRVNDLKRAAPEKLFQLHRNIELVNLDTLIVNFKKLLDQPKKTEKRWQKIFDLNPFILSMIFGYPVVKVLREASVGAPHLDGSGAKIADFLAKNPVTSNAALVELKTPQAELLAAKPYRGATNANPVYQPHADLSGAVAQVLDQRYRLQKDIATHRSNNRGLELTTYHVDCVVVAGRTPEDEDCRQSFEIYRQSLKDVRIVTFDELLIKLESLREFLATTARPAAEADEAAKAHELIRPEDRSKYEAEDDFYDLEEDEEDIVLDDELDPDDVLDPDEA